MKSFHLPAHFGTSIDFVQLGWLEKMNYNKKETNVKNRSNKTSNLDKIIIENIVAVPGNMDQESSKNEKSQEIKYINVSDESTGIEDYSVFETIGKKLSDTLSLIQQIVPDWKSQYYWENVKLLELLSIIQKVGKL